ncbi:MAG TPA: hypothetical protein DCP92_11165 [Nitrospiraceae bacterium]|nr:hypothetical protein [Nitrospiraceae bacterium]
MISFVEDLFYHNEIKAGRVTRLCILLNLNQALVMHQKSSSEVRRKRVYEALGSHLSAKFW